MIGRFCHDDRELVLILVLIHKICYCRRQEMTVFVEHINIASIVIIMIMHAKRAVQLYFVVEQGKLKCEWTLKYFQGVTGGKWVVSVQWILDCMREGSLLPEVYPVISSYLWYRTLNLRIESFTLCVVYVYVYK